MLRKNIALSAASNIYSVLANLLLAIYISRAFGSEVKGSLSLMPSVCDWVLMLVTFGIPNGLSYYVAKRDILISTTSKIFLVYTTLASIILYSLLKLVRFEFLNVFLGKEHLFCAIIGMLMISNYCTTILLTMKRGDKVAYYNFLQVNCYCGLVYLGLDNKFNAIDVWVYTQLIASTIFLYEFYCMCKVNTVTNSKYTEFNPPVIFRSFKLGATFFLSSLAANFFNNYLNIVINENFGLATLGVFSVAYSIYKAILLFPKTVISNIYGEFIGGSNQSNKKLVNKLTLSTIVISSILLILSLMYSERLIVIFFGSEFALSSKYLNLLIIMMLPTILLGYLSTYLVARGNAWLSTILNTLPVILAIAILRLLTIDYVELIIIFFILVKFVQYFLSFYASVNAIEKYE